MNGMKSIELSAEDLELMERLLSKELETIKIEIHHSRNHDYKDYLKDTEKEVQSLRERVKTIIGVSV